MKTNLRSVGVVGVGVIGWSLVQALAQAGYRVVAVDSSRDALASAERSVARSVRTHRLVSPDSPHQDVSAVLERVEFTEDIADLREVALVVENVVEEWDVKESVYRSLEVVCGPGTVFVANTSCIPITKLGSILSEPSRLLGIHFMNPVPLSKAAEVVRGHHTSDETVAVAFDLLDSLGKSPIVVGDGPGFVSNRVLMLTINEAILLAKEGIATPKDIDRVFVECFGHAMGPLATADLIGLDTILRSIRVLQEEFGDSKYRPAPLLSRMVEAGQLGRKSGSGFFAYATRSSDKSYQKTE